MMEKRFFLHVAAWLLAGLVFISLSGAARCAGSLSGSPLEDLYRLKDGRTMRASSSDPAWDSGNGDWRPFSSNTSITIAELEGPGIIIHIWMTIACKDRDYSKLMAVRMYWDGEKQPSVEAPVGDFFAAGHGVDAPVNSIPVQVSSEGRARNSFWPMPFRKSAKIVITNENTSSSGGVLYWYVDWVKVDSLPGDTAYFHAQYRQEYPAGDGRYLVMQAGGRGHYAGTVYSVLANMPGWIGEGDDFFFIDGEDIPSIKGTGTEDYFSDAWGFRQFNHPYHGVTIWEDSRVGSRTTAYRWHIQDPVIFNESLRFEIEHTGPVYDDDGNLSAHYGQRPDHYSTVAFWYQQGGGPNWTRMPRGRKRLPPHLYIEAEDRYRKKGSTPENVEIVTGYDWSGGGYAEFTPAEDGREYEVGFRMKKGGRFEMAADIVHGPAMGSYIAKLDGKILGTLDNLNNDTLHTSTYNWGAQEIGPGRHRLTFEFQGPLNGAEKFGLDGIYLRPLGFEK